MSSGSPPTLWWDLIFAATPSPPSRRTRSRPSRASPGRGSGTSPSRCASSSKTRMNSSPIRSRFSSGSVTPASRARKRSLRVDVDERDVEVAAERLDHLRRLVLAQQAVVDEDAGELVADRLVDEQRGDRRVDAAGERAEHALAADLRADPLDLLLDHGRRRPGRRRARRRRRGSSSAPPCRAACARPRGGTGRRRGRAPAPRRRRSASTASRRSTRAPVGAARRPSRGGSSRPSAPRAGRRRGRRPRRAARSCRTRRRRCARRAPPRSCAISCMP